MKKAKYFITSDGVEFHTENFARNHAKTLTDKKVIFPGEKISISDFEAVDEEIITDILVDTTDHSKISATTDEPKIEVKATADGSLNILKDGENAGTLAINLIPLSADATKEVVNTGGEEIKPAKTPIVDTPKVEAKQENKPNTKK